MVFKQVLEPPSFSAAIYVSAFPNERSRTYEKCLKAAALNQRWWDILRESSARSLLGCLLQGQLLVGPHLQNPDSQLVQMGWRQPPVSDQRPR